MRTHGRLSKWNDERGFGFILPAQGTEEIFVHVSAFPRDGTRPQLDELVSYETEVDARGKRRAVNVRRPGTAKGRPAPASRHAPRARRRSGGAVLMFGLVAALAVGGYHRMHEDMPWPALQTDRIPTPKRSLEADGRFTCDGRTRCRQMTSCAEAKYFLAHCPDTEMDGDGDGVPCEDQWCRDQTSSPWYRNSVD